MKTYLKALSDVMTHGVSSDDRTGVGTIRLFGYQMRFDLVAGFPLVTTKKVNFKNVLCELLWFLKGRQNVQWLHNYGVHIWDPWAGPNGDCGPIYGVQWRCWNPGIQLNRNVASVGGIDQLRNVIDQIRENPDSRRHIVTAWNPSQTDDMVLPPCHCMFQFGVINGRISLHLYQRSADLFIGVPYNIALYALLLVMVALATKLKVGDLVISYGDIHIYKNHFDQVTTQLGRDPRSLPVVSFDKVRNNIWEYEMNEIHLQGYHPHPFIKAPVAV